MIRTLLAVGVTIASTHHITVMVDGDVVAVACSETTPVLDALATVYRGTIVSGCRGGGCGVCRVIVHAGEHRCGPMSRTHVTSDEARTGVALACRLFPQSDLLLEAVGRRRTAPTRTPQASTNKEIRWEF